MKGSRIALLGALVCAGNLANAAMSVLFNRNLPTENLNLAAGANRTNYAWANYWLDGPNGQNPTYIGDDYTIDGPGSYRIQKIRLWVAGDDNAPFGGYPMSLLGTTQTLGLAGLQELSSTFTYGEVNYVNLETYQRSNGAFMKLWYVDFATDFIVQGGEKQLFFLKAVRPHPLFANHSITPYLHTSNKDLSGVPMPGADDKMLNLVYDKDGVTPIDIHAWDNSQFGYSFAKTDVNIQVFGEAVVPGPAAALPFLLGLAAAARRRRK